MGGSVGSARRALAAAAIWSAAAHLALFWLLAPVAGQTAPLPASVLSVSRIDVRLARAVAVGPPVVEASTEPADELPPSVGEVAVSGIGSTSQTDPGQTMRTPQDPAVTNPSTIWQQQGVDGYLPRSALSRPPVPVGEIELRWPEGLLAVGQQSGIFWMFVDETGIVRRFEADGPTLQPQLEEIARSTFLSARFEPGQRDGEMVRSLIRIEVVFDNRPSTSAARVVAERIL